MKIPLAYPKIPNTVNCPLKQCVVFEKYDGTNLHWVWRYGSFESFGTRRSEFTTDNIGVDLFKKEHPNLKDAPDVFWSNGLDAKLDEFLHNKLYLLPDYENKKVVIFTEYFGNGSFAGSHQNDEKQCVIIDVMIDGKFLPPKNFIEEFSEFNIARPIFQGKYSGQLVEDIRNGKYPVKEGAIIKGVIDNQIYMAKVKTNSYMEKLKAQYEDNWKDYWE